MGDPADPRGTGQTSATFGRDTGLTDMGLARAMGMDPNASWADLTGRPAIPGTMSGLLNPHDDQARVWNQARQEVGMPHHNEEGMWTTPNPEPGIMGGIRALGDFGSWHPGPPGPGPTRGGERTMGPGPNPPLLEDPTAAGAAPGAAPETLGPADAELLAAMTGAPAPQGAVPGGGGPPLTQPPVPQMMGAGGGMGGAPPPSPLAASAAQAAPAGMQGAGLLAGAGGGGGPMGYAPPGGGGMSPGLGAVAGVHPFFGMGAGRFEGEEGQGNEMQQRDRLNTLGLQGYAPHLLDQSIRATQQPWGSGGLPPLYTRR